jgi:hypothetical protein
MDNQKIIEQIKRLAEKTKEKKVPWVFQNPNLFRWTKVEGTKTYITTLQAPPISPNKNYFLTIQTNNPPQVILQINSLVQPIFKNCLEDLYIEVSSISEDTTAETMSKLLDSLN